jgi:DNA-binding CsgD family transcriptional regulator
LWAVLDLARLADVPLTGVFEGLSFDAVSARSQRSVPWDDYCIVCERLEQRCGGPEACWRLLTNSYHLVLPEFRALAGRLISPMTFARTVLEGLSPIVYEGCSFAFESLTRDQLRLELRLRPGARPSTTFFRATVGELRALPRHLSLPAAKVVADFGPTYGNYLVTLPPSRSLTDRVVRRARDSVVRLVLGFAADGAPMTFSFGGTSAGSAQSRLEAARLAWELTDRQQTVLACVIEGASNKEIAETLGCAENTVEFHVTQLLRRARVTSRARLMAHFWSKL